MKMIMLAALAFNSSSSPSNGSGLQPTGKWVINYAEAQCVASRPFGNKDNPLYLLIKLSPTSDVVQISLIKDGRQFNGVQRAATVKFGNFPGNEVNILEYGTAQKKSVKLLNMSPAMASQLAQSQRIEWRTDWSTKDNLVELETGPLGEVMKVMAACRDDLRKYWHIGPDNQSDIKERVKPVQPLARYFSTDDYPMQAAADREGGVSSIVLLIDEKGTIQDCMVDDTSGIATLDAMTCIVLAKRAKFEPAIGHDGKAVKDAFTQRVRWEMP
jgi:TonB family protein